jgi:hypothetical protein
MRCYGFGQRTIFEGQYIDTAALPRSSIFYALQTCGWGGNVERGGLWKQGGPCAH